MEVEFIFELSEEAKDNENKNQKYLDEHGPYMAILNPKKSLAHEAKKYLKKYGILEYFIPDQFFCDGKEITAAHRLIGKLFPSQQILLEGLESKTKIIKVTLIRNEDGESLTETIDDFQNDEIEKKNDVIIELTKALNKAQDSIQNMKKDLDSNQEIQNKNIYNQIATITLVGGPSTGKTSILNRYTQNTFNSSEIYTTAMDYSIAYIKDTKINIYDTAGQENYTPIRKSYSRKSDGIFLVYSVTDKNSFYAIEKILNDIEYSENQIYYILGNKCDLIDDRKVCIDDVKDLIGEKNFKFKEVSAKTGVNIKEAFEEMVDAITSNGYYLRNKESEGIRLIHDKNEKKNCC